jgi:hypothetical protein
MWHAPVTSIPGRFEREAAGIAHRRIFCGGQSTNYGRQAGPTTCPPVILFLLPLP